MGPPLAMVSDGTQKREKSSQAKRSSLSRRVDFANKSADAVTSTKIVWVYVAIGLILPVIHSLAYLTAEYGIAGGKNTYSEYTEAQTCLSSLANSKFDLLNTKDYHKWMDDNTVLDLAETGTYAGPAEIAEYAEFVDAAFFSYYKRTSALAVTPMLMTDKECSVNFVTTNRMQIKVEYQPRKMCLETVVGYTLVYEPKPFRVKNINLYYQGEFLALLFGSNGLDTDKVRDYVCGIMAKNCQETMMGNNVTYETCRARYDSLPPTNEKGYLDDNSKACRILHSSFAAVNPDHCAHLSFTPQLDWRGRIKCQKSYGAVPGDFFSEFELDTIRNKARQWGFNKTTLTRTCPYDPDAERVDPNYPKTLPFAKSVPTEGLNDYQFLIYAGFVMYATMVLAGVGSEYLVWRIVLAGEWTQEMEWRWKVAQFVFPILGATTVGLANTGNYLALPFLVVTMWKLGFPEVTMLFFAALYQKDRTTNERFVDFVIGMGTIVHHSSSALYVAMLVTHVLPSNRDVIAVTLPLVMQHWVVLLKYNHKLLYIVCEIIIEAWWEWTAFSVLPAVHELHWIGGVILLSMLFAHWCYFGGGIFAILFVPKMEEEDTMAKRRTSGMAQRLSVLTLADDVMFQMRNVEEESEDSEEEALYGEHGDDVYYEEKGDVFSQEEGTLPIKTSAAQATGGHEEPFKEEQQRKEGPQGGVEDLFLQKESTLPSKTNAAQATGTLKISVFAAYVGDTRNQLKQATGGHE